MLTIKCLAFVSVVWQTLVFGMPTENQQPFPRCQDPDITKSDIDAWLILAKESKWCQFVGLKDGCKGNEGTRALRPIYLSWHPDKCKSGHASLATKVTSVLNDANKIFALHENEIVPTFASTNDAHVWRPESDPDVGLHKFDESYDHAVGDEPEEPSNYYYKEIKRDMFAFNSLIMGRGLFGEYFHLKINPHSIHATMIAHLMRVIQEHHKFPNKAKVMLFMTVVEAHNDAEYHQTQQVTDFASNMQRVMDNWNALNRKRFINNLKIIAHHGPYSERIFKLWADEFDLAIGVNTHTMDKFSQFNAYHLAPFGAGFSNRLLYWKFEAGMTSKDKDIRAMALADYLWLYVETVLRSTFRKSLDILVHHEPSSEIVKKRIGAMREMVEILRKIKQVPADSYFFKEGQKVHGN